MNTYHGLPVIDLSSLFSSCTTDLDKLANEFSEIYSASGSGVAYITHHGILQQDIDAMFAQAKQFHALPETDKLPLKQGRSSLGYIPMESSTLRKSSLGSQQLPNQSSAFVFLRELKDNKHPPSAQFFGHNQWPAEKVLPHFKTTAISYVENMVQLMHRLIRVFSRALTGVDHMLESYFNPPTVFLRLQYYPASPIKKSEEQYGLAPHTDYGVMTLLAQEDIGGLQVKQADNTWLDVPPLANAFVLNTGDMLQYISNHRFIATPHRVINHSGKNRYSIPLFFDPNIHSLIRPLDIKAEPSSNTSILYGDYLLDRIKHNYPVELIS